MVTNFELLNMAAILSTAVVTRYLRGKLLTGPAYRRFGGEGGSNGTKPRQHSEISEAANEPAPPSRQTQADGSRLPSRRRAF
jgi:hypothetical protein